jgi:polyisoprenoid-binding protein YceI
VADIAGTYELGPGAGRVLVRTGREGLAARAGHDLTLEITQWSAQVTIPGAADGGLAAATLTASLDLASLAVREGTGGAKPLSDKDRRDIQHQARKILGTTAPASFASTQVIPAAGSGGDGTIEGSLTLHGTSGPMRLEVTSPAAGRYRGSGTVRQTDFGITPYSGFFGALKLRDTVTVEFEVTIEVKDQELRNGSG